MTNLVQLSHEKIRRHLTNSSFCMDATIGNGGDTLFLANLTGNKGKVFGFDIQESALVKTNSLLVQNNLQEKAQLILACHSKFDHFVPVELKGAIKTIFFNLGYLPGSNKKIITQEKTTLVAIEKAYAWLAKGGIISVISYTGHAGGMKETKSLLNFVEEKKWKRERFNGSESINSPILHLITKD